jgi:hypothetical protein
LSPNAGQEQLAVGCAQELPLIASHAVTAGCGALSLLAVDFPLTQPNFAYIFVIGQADVFA